jgi:hypothetical protein
MLNARQRILLLRGGDLQADSPGRRTAALLLRFSDCCWINRWL